MPDSPPVVREAFPKTVRLVSTARLRPPVLAGLVGADDLAALAEIEGATSQRLIGEAHGTAGFGRDEFVHGVPYASFINAAFAYAKPLEPNRFNAARGAWYAALAVQTSMREVAWHMADFLGKSGAVQGRRRLRRNVRQHGRRIRRPQSRGPPSVSRSGSLDRISGRQRDRQFRLRARASTASSIRPFGMPGEPASRRCGLMRCSRSPRGRSIDLNGRAIRTQRSRPFRNRSGEPRCAAAAEDARGRCRRGR